MELPDDPVAVEHLKRATAYRNRLWSMWLGQREDRRVAELASYCTALCGGDATAGEALATEAIWS